MNDYSEHIAIIGGGIAGLSLGCFLLRKDIQPIIFERSSQIREGGAGISISPNAINLLDKINLKESCLLYTSPSPRDPVSSRMPSSA